MERLITFIRKYICCCTDLQPENFTILSNNRPTLNINCSCFKSQQQQQLDQTDDGAQEEGEEEKCDDATDIL